jgi:hypothetical protein
MDMGSCGHTGPLQPGWYGPSASFGNDGRAVPNGDSAGQHRMLAAQGG